MCTSESSPIGAEPVSSLVYIAPGDMNLDIGEVVTFQLESLPYRFSVATTYIPAQGRFSEKG